jgi:hypothetical protein
MKQDRKCTFNVILRRFRGTIFAVEQHNYYIFRQWVFLILISSKQCACAILSGGHATLQYFSTFAHKRHDFRKKKNIGNKMCVLIFCRTLSATFLILRITERDVIKNVISSHVKSPVFLVRF